jgi:hypothetical protein
MRTPALHGLNSISEKIRVSAVIEAEARFVASPHHANQEQVVQRLKDLVRGWALAELLQRL